MAARSAAARTDALDVVVELLSGLDTRSDASDDFYDRICEALCRLTSMRRAGLFLWDDARKIVSAVGCHGLDPDLLLGVYGTLEETPIAQRALAQDEVVEAGDDLAREVPGRYARFGGITALSCTPLAAGGRWLGVIFADRGGGHFELTDSERQAMRTLGKTAALAASARIATSEQARSRQLSEWIDFARGVHERVIQRLFGVSLALGSELELGEEERARCAKEMQAALADLRGALAKPPAPAPEPADDSLRDELARLGRYYKDLPLEVAWELDDKMPRELDPLAQSVLREALRNADKHASPSTVEVRVWQLDGAYALEVRNDGVPETRRLGARPGMGLRLAAMEALERGGVVEFGAEKTGEWRVRLVVPPPEAER